MSIISKEELRNMGQDELVEKLTELKKELIKENAQVAVGTNPKSPGKMKQLKKTIAKIIQILNTKEVKKTNE